MRRANYERESETVAFSGFLNAERQRILAAATPKRRAQMEAAEESRTVYRAWNAVCSGTREGRHVTGLRYLPESNELLVYLDSPSWTQEMTLLREIIRARMERAGCACGRPGVQNHRARSHAARRQGAPAPGDDRATAGPACRPK